MEEKEINGIEPEGQNQIPQEQAEQPEHPESVQTEPAQTESVQTEQTYYHGAGAGRREETYSAFHTPQQPCDQQTYYQQPLTPEPPRKEKKKGRVWKTILASVLILALVGGSCLGTYYAARASWNKEYEQMKLYLSDKITALEKQIAASAGPGSISGGTIVVGEGMTPSQVYAANINSVVSVTCTIDASDFGPSKTATSAGSGFILTADGYIVTNYHVVEGATSVSVTLADGTKLNTQVKGYDQTNDIAVLKAEAEGLDPVTLGRSSHLMVGDQVIAIGNALGELSFSLTVGYISGTDREVTTDGSVLNMLQTDTAINSGNSGGPLFNAKGEVIGITTAKYSGTTSSGASIDNISFAIPIDDVTGIINDICQYGYVTGAYLGVSVSDVNPIAQAYGVPAGAFVNEVVPGNCAAAAGVRAEDIIVELGGFDVESVNDLTRALRNFKAGETSTILVWRQGVEVLLTITFDEKPAQIG